MKHTSQVTTSFHIHLQSIEVPSLATLKNAKPCSFLKAMNLQGGKETRSHFVQIGCNVTAPFRQTISENSSFLAL